MKKHKKALYACVAVITAACITTPFLYAYKEATVYAAVNVNTGFDINRSQYDDTISQAEQTKKEYEEKAAAVQAEIDNLSFEYDSILSYIEELDAKQSALTAQVVQISEKLDELEAEKALTEAELEKATADMNEQYETMCARIKYIYENGETSYWDILVSSASLADMLNRVEYVSEISEYDDNLFTKYQESVRLVSEYNDTLAIQMETLENVKSTYDVCILYADEIKEAKNNALDECAAALGVSKELYEEYGAMIESQQMTIDEAKAAKAEEERKAQQQQQQPGKTPDGSGSSSVSQITQSDETGLDNMIWPLPGNSMVSSYFGYRESPGAGASTYHRGIDIPGSYGTPIVAAIAGTVTYAGYGWSQGNYVNIDHGNGVQTVYMHCSSLAVSSGTYVQQGQVIGYVGNTGISYGNHLHFGVNINGEYVNPLNYVAY
ncbi:MAG: murein hydrolase activator EnvC family protein [Lachnospiraceae bacterium]